MVVTDNFVVDLLHQRDLLVILNVSLEPLYKVGVVAGLLVPLQSCTYFKDTSHQVGSSLRFVLFFKVVRVLVVKGLELLDNLIKSCDEDSWVDCHQFV